MNIRIDPEFKELIPPLTRDERGILEVNISNDGCLDPIKLWGGVIVDGHNRYEICTSLGIKFDTQELQFKTRDDAIIWIISNQFGRRNLNNYIRSALALRLEETYRAIAKRNQVASGERFGKGLQNSANPINPIDTRLEVAKVAGVSHDTIAKVKQINAKATPEQKIDVETGEKSINQVFQEIKKQDQRIERVEKIVEISKGNEPLSNIQQTFPVIYADPPWQYDYSVSDSRKIENQYPTMALDQIKAMDVKSISTDDCVLFLWTTSPKLKDSFEVLDAWGFKYKTCAVWDKKKIGMGYYFRQQHELLLVATKGNIPAPLPEFRPSSVFAYERGEHSSKPHEVYEMIEKMYSEFAKIELFCRSPRSGWTAWGNQS